MINTVKIPRAYSEVYSFINTLGTEYIEKIPSKIYNTIKDNRDKEYNPIYQKNQTIKEEMLSYEALCLISALNLQYWCNDPEEKNILKKKYVDNTKKEQETYSYDNLFKTNQSKIQPNISENISNESDESKHTQMIEYKESIFTKIKNWFKRTF